MEEDRKKWGAFEVIYIVMLAVLLVLAVFYMGKPKVGVIDLGRIAEEVGIEDKIVEDAEEWRDAAGVDLKELRDQYSALGKGIKDKALEAETEDEKLALQKDLNDATRQYYTETAKLRARVNKHQQAVLRTFRMRLDPFITEVARKRRVWLVLDRSARLVYATAQIDITDEVTEKAMPFFAEQQDLVDAELTAEDVAEIPPEEEN